MLICPKCASSSMTVEDGCQACRFVPATRDGFVAWAPDLLHAEIGFPAENFPLLASVEAGNFWFRSRNLLVVWFLRKYFPDFGSLLEVGCGTGFVLSGISQAFPGKRLVGSEIFTEGLRFAAQRLPQAEFCQADARSLPYADEFDVVASFDVLEHIKEDEDALRSLCRAVRPGGGCLITVPQHRWLWSPVDDEACHERRYEAADLHGKLEAAGFEILTSTSFVTLLLPAMLLSRGLDKLSRRSAAGNELQLSPWLNRLFLCVMTAERLAVKAGLRWPWGGSRLVVARRPG